MTGKYEMAGLDRELTRELPQQLIGYAVSLVRLLTGWWFLDVGIQKYANLWTRQGPFTAGWFLEIEGTLVSPVLNAFQGGATEAFVNVVIPLGEVLIGLGLVLGCLTRVASFFGTVLLFVLYVALGGFQSGLVNTTLFGLVAFVTVLIFGAGQLWSVDRYLERMEFVQSRRWLQYLLG